MARRACSTSRRPGRPTSAPSVMPPSAAARPRRCPASITLVYSGGTTATLEGTPQPGDGGTYTVCLERLQRRRHPWRPRPSRSTVNAPAATSPPPHHHPPPAATARVLAGGLRRGHLHVRLGPVLRLDRLAASAAARGGHRADGRPGWLLARRLRRRHLRLRRRGVPRLDPRRRPQPGGLGPAAQPQRAHRRHGALARRRRVLHGGVRRRRLRLRRRSLRGLVPGHRRLPGAAVAVVPDATGNGYWVVTNTGAVYTFGDAVNHGAPGPQSSPITSAVATPNGGGYWILDGAGQVFPYGNAAAPGRHARRRRRRLRPGLGHLRDLRRRGLLGRHGAGQGDTLRGRARTTGTCRARTSTGRSSPRPDPEADRARARLEPIVG